MDEVMNYSKDVTAVTLLQRTIKLHEPCILSDVHHNESSRAYYLVMSMYSFC